MKTSKEHLTNATNNFKTLVTGLILTFPQIGIDLLSMTKEEVKSYEENKDLLMLEYAMERLRIIKSILTIQKRNY